MRMPTATRTRKGSCSRWVNLVAGRRPRASFAAAAKYLPHEISDLRRHLELNFVLAAVVLLHDEGEPPGYSARDAEPSLDLGVHNARREVPAHQKAPAAGLFRQIEPASALVDLRHVIGANGRLDERVSGRADDQNGRSGITAAQYFANCHPAETTACRGASSECGHLNWPPVGRFFVGRIWARLGGDTAGGGGRRVVANFGPHLESDFGIGVVGSEVREWHGHGWSCSSRSGGTSGQKAHRCASWPRAQHVHRRTVLAGTSQRGPAGAEGIQRRPGPAIDPYAEVIDG